MKFSTSIDYSTKKLLQMLTLCLPQFANIKYLKKGPQKEVKGHVSMRGVFFLHIYWFWTGLELGLAGLGTKGLRPGLDNISSTWKH